MTERIFLARPFLGEEELESMRPVLESGFLVEGKLTREFEQRVAEYVAARFGVATTCCTTALETALRAFKVHGSEVIVPAFTHPATVDAVISAGGTPVLVDVGLKERNVTARNIEFGLTGNTKAVVAVSLFGQPLERDVYDTCSKHGVPIVEDAACTLGAEIEGVRVGSLADATCFSFHPRKIITTGEGGMITTNSEETSTFCRLYKSFGLNQGEFQEYGTNYRFTELQAAIGLCQLRKLDKLIDLQRQKARLYDELLHDVQRVEVPEQGNHVKNTYQTYAIYFEEDRDRDRVRTALHEQSIESQIGSYAIHLQPIFAHLKRAENLANSELLYKRLLALPLHHALTEEDQTRIARIIRGTV